VLVFFLLVVVSPECPAVHPCLLVLFPFFFVLDCPFDFCLLDCQWERKRDVEDPFLLDANKITRTSVRFLHAPFSCHILRTWWWPLVGGGWGRAFVRACMKSTRMCEPATFWPGRQRDRTPLTAIHPSVGDLSLSLCPASYCCCFCCSISIYLLPLSANLFAVDLFLAVGWHCTVHPGTGSGAGRRKKKNTEATSKHILFVCLSMESSRVPIWIIWATVLQLQLQLHVQCSISSGSRFLHLNEWSFVKQQGTCAARVLSEDPVLVRASQVDVSVQAGDKHMRACMHDATGQPLRTFLQSRHIGVHGAKLVAKMMTRSEEEDSAWRRDDDVDRRLASS
jgi:hypothetical protein